MLSRATRRRIEANKKRHAVVAWKRKLTDVWRLIDTRLKLRINGRAGRNAGVPLPYPPDLENRQEVVRVYRSATHHSHAPAVMAKLRKLSVQVTGYEAH